MRATVPAEPRAPGALTVNAWAARPEDEPGALLFGSEVRLQVSPSRGRKADVLGWFPGHVSLPARGAVGVPPDLDAPWAELDDLATDPS